MNGTGKSRPVVLVMSILVGYQTLVGGAALADYIGLQLAGLLILIGAAVQTGMQFYVQSQVVPVKDVVEYATGSGAVLAGPANELPAGKKIRELVVPAEPGAHRDDDGDGLADRA